MTDPTRRLASIRGMLVVPALMLCLLATGCAAITNPMANGIPVRLVPPELLAAERREETQTIPLTLLRQPTPDLYRLAPGDVLGVFIDGILPYTSPDRPRTEPPVFLPQQTDPVSAGLPPSFGYPVQVREDGTVALPLVDPINVDGMSLQEATEAIRRPYIDQELLNPDNERIFITVMQPRQSRVLVFRQETGGFATGGRGDIAAGSTKRGTAEIINLRAYENDVLHAMALTGGLPGDDSFDAIIIFKGGQADPALAATLENLKPGEDPIELGGVQVPVVRIPSRWPKGEPLPFRPEDVILETGDVVFLDSRDLALFYTAGLLPPGEHQLPRDIDLDVIEAVARVGGPLLNGAFAGNTLVGGQLGAGLGNPSPSLLTIIRRAPDGSQVPIRVDMNRAFEDARERILIQPGDILVLQQTPGEAFARYIGQAFSVSIFGEIFTRGDASATASALIP